MRAMTVGNPATLENLKLVDIPDAGSPGPGEILVKLHASSLNYKDFLVATGLLPVDAGRIPLCDGAGEVLAVGEGVVDLAVGDRVVAVFHTRWPAGEMPSDAMRGAPGDTIDGYARQFAVAPATWFSRAPEGYSHAEAATLTCAGLTAWRALVPDGPVIAGQTVLVQGTGGVSLFALQFAKAMGAIVIATSSSDAKLERLKALGADHLINYKTLPEWGEAAFNLTGGVDHVVEVGGSGTLPQSIAATGYGGHISLVGVLTGRGGEIPSGMITRKRLRVQGVQVGSRKDHFNMIAAINATGIRPVIDRSLPLEELAPALSLQESGVHFGKITIDIG
ncbi:zinc-dependent alcohol dehydrogenase family protein [Sphingomonas sp. SRS2]|uniref:zinc-dependent alcohol dehydrogenase family protein n=1 Tax=Sphingomonas sp. SRS2 TaxID=133190 RepID=UPI0006184B1F|nr:NAD(P)-dependent alcohol dehydrogenase [Sphingomonas sp. SRS2]KKC24173.1 NADPH:quinone oxidoreductase [Sphingomonas sp. SRS2]